MAPCRGRRRGVGREGKDVYSAGTNWSGCFLSLSRLFRSANCASTACHAGYSPSVRRARSGPVPIKHQGGALEGHSHREHKCQGARCGEHHKGKASVATNQIQSHTRVIISRDPKQHSTHGCSREEVGAVTRRIDQGSLN